MLQQGAFIPENDPLLQLRFPYLRAHGVLCFYLPCLCLQLGVPRKARHDPSSYFPLWLQHALEFVPNQEGFSDVLG